MKKLFFAALVAVVAVGGAYANDYAYDLGGPNQVLFSCSEGGTSCSEFASYPANSITDITTPASPVVVADNTIFLELQRTAE